MAGVVALTSIATVLVSGWMTVMFLVLRHPGYQWRAAMAGTICLGAVALLAGRPPRALRVPVAIWGAALAALGVWALRAPADDGWVAIAATLFVIEGALAVAAATSRPRTA